LFIPQWANLPPQYGDTDVGVYTGYANVNAMKNTFLQRCLSDYTGVGATFLANNLEFWATQWRGMNMLVMGNPSNLAPNTNLSTLFPDYLDVYSGTTDYGRMSNTTITFLEALGAALEVARTAGPTTTIDSTYTLVSDSGRYYLAFQYTTFRILILTKYSYNTLS